LGSQEIDKLLVIFFLPLAQAFDCLVELPSRSPIR
jgi:hypothetical protein